MAMFFQILWILKHTIKSTRHWALYSKLDESAFMVCPSGQIQKQVSPDLERSRDKCMLLIEAITKWCTQSIKWSVSCHIIWWNSFCFNVFSTPSIKIMLWTYYMLVTDSGECFVFHIFSAGIIMFTRHIQWCYNFDQQTRERHDLVAWRLCSLLTDSNFIQPNKLEMQNWLDEEVVQNFTMSAAKSLLEPCFWPQVSLIFQRSWNLSEQICDAHSLKACAQLLSFTVCPVYIPIYSLWRQWGRLMLQPGFKPTASSSRAKCLNFTAMSWLLHGRWLLPKYPLSGSRRMPLCPPRRERRCLWQS